MRWSTWRASRCARTCHRHAADGWRPLCRAGVLASDGLQPSQRSSVRCRSSSCGSDLCCQTLGGWGGEGVLCSNAVLERTNVETHSFPLQRLLPCWWRRRRWLWWWWWWCCCCCCCCCCLCPVRSLEPFFKALPACVRTIGDTFSHLGVYRYYLLLKLVHV